MTRWAKGKRMPGKDRASLRVETLENREVPSTVTGPSSSQSPYLVPTAPGIEITSIMSVGDSVNLKPDGVTPYRAVGIMDGLGAYDNYDGTFTVVMNHELPIAVNSAGVATPTGVVRAHGNAGAFVSLWTIDKNTLEVLNVEDLLENNTSIYLSNNDPGTGAIHSGYLAAGTTAIARLCSADLAEPSAYSWFDSSTFTFYGTTARIFQTGEESGGIASSISGGGNLGEPTVHFGRQFNVILTDDPAIPGDQSRTAYEMPHCGLFAWENNLASPYPQRKTITAGMDDGSPIGQLYFWVGDKQTTGNVVERAGLTRQSTNDNLWVVKVPSLLTVDGSGVPLEDRSAPVSGAFQLVKSGVNGDASGLTFAQLEADSDSKGAAQFLRPEDGQWDPKNPNDYYFVTTDRYDQVKDGVGTQIARSRLYRLRFADITKPELGGTIESVLDGTGPGNMYDNMTIDGDGNVLIQEDPGNQQHNAKIWRYDIATGEMIQIAQHDQARFGNLGVAATAPFNQDEETSGIVSLENILGKGKYLANVQAHYAIPGELVEGGQLLVIDTNAPVATLSNRVLTIEGTIDADTIIVSRLGQTLTVSNGFATLATFDNRKVDTVIVKAANGNDFVYIAQNVQADAILLGGSGNDYLVDGGGTSILIGGTGQDWLYGGSKSDLLVGGTTAHDNDDQTLQDILAVWAGSGSYAQRRTAIGTWLNATTVADDGERDYMFGLGGLDLFFAGAGDWTDARPGETVY